MKHPKRFKTEASAKQALFFSPSSLRGAYYCATCKGWHIGVTPRKPA